MNVYEWNIQSLITRSYVYNTAETSIKHLHISLINSYRVKSSTNNSAPYLWNHEPECVAISDLVNEWSWFSKVQGHGCKTPSPAELATFYRSFLKCYTCCNLLPELDNISHSEGQYKCNSWITCRDPCFWSSSGFYLPAVSAECFSNIFISFRLISYITLELVFEKMTSIQSFFFRGHPYIRSHEFHDFLPLPPLSQMVTLLRPPPPSVTSHILQFYT